MKKENIMLLLAELSYKKNIRIKEECRINGLGVVIIRVVKDLKYIVIKYEGELFISIRGSANRKNWIRNGKIWKKKTKFGKIHSGFYSGAELIVNDLKKVITATHRGKINISGHSLGSALAFVVAVTLERDRGYKINDVRCYAHPTVTNRLLYDYKFTYLKFYNNLDAIYRTPPTFLGYRNDLKKAVYVTDSGNKYFNPSKEFIEQDRLRTLMEHKELKEFYKDHEILYYKKLLWE